MNAHNMKTLEGLLLALLIAGTVGTLSAYSTPSGTAPNNNTPAPINEGPDAQNINAGLSLVALQVGTTGSIVIDSDGKMAIGETTTDKNSGARLYVANKGTIKIASLASSTAPALRILCTEKVTSPATMSDFKACGAPKVTFPSATGNNYPNSFQIPAGVSKITVEVYGAGAGAGTAVADYGDAESEITGGERSRFYGNGVEIIANGGQPTPSLTFGPPSNFGPSQVIQQSNAEKGGAGGTASGGDTNTTGNKGADGTASTCTGGTGGANPGTEGGKGGTGGPGTNVSPSSGTWPAWRPGKDGATYGAGAGGAGCENTKSGTYKGFGGGGSGGYSKKTFTVTPGQVYRLEIGKGGYGGQKGGDGAVIISYN